MRIFETYSQLAVISLSHVDRKQSVATVDTMDTAVQADYLAVAPGEVKPMVVCIAHT